MNVGHRHGAAALFAIGLYVVAQAASGGTTDAVVRSLLSRMTLEEKMAMIRGEREPAATNQGQPGYLTGVPRLGIPALRMADGPPGVLTRVPSPALTATMGLAATFSRDDARLNGIVIGDEANRLGIDVSLQPFVNIDRDIFFMRGYNTYGEDPLLTGTIGSEVIQGLQSRGVMAQVKHYVGYDSEATDITIDMQSLHEVYLAPFDAAVKAGVASIMCSYNRINGPYACGNKDTLVRILRGEMGFRGFVTSDWGAVHDYDYIAKGLDMEMPGRPAKDDPYAYLSRSYFDTEEPVTRPIPAELPDISVFTGAMPEEPVPPPGEPWSPPTGAYKNLWNALKEGVVTQAMIDHAAGHVLSQMARFGYFDGSREKLIKTPSGVDAADVIRKTGEDAAVLLKNDAGILPLSKEKSGSIALIGPGAAQVVAIGKSGERSVGLPGRQVGPFKALTEAMSGADLRLAIADDMTGGPVPAAALAQDGTHPGLTHTADGSPAGIDLQVDFVGAQALKPGTNHVWQGVLKVPASGRYILAVQTLGSRGTLTIDGTIVASTSGSQGDLHGDIVQAGQDDLFPTRDGLNSARGAAELSAGTHTLVLKVDADSSGAPVQARLNWVTPPQREATYAAAIAAAKAATTAVVFVWCRDVPVFGLPGDQDGLVEAVTAVNPNTIVVLNVSQPVAMPWIDKVKGVVQMWWPGDEGGWATADILTGSKNPAGRLPFTWARHLEDYAASDPAHPERAGNNPGGKATFSEGVDVGYRWFDRQGTVPLFPFGHGLSYTSFAYSDLSVVRARRGGIDVTFLLKNTGSVEGEEVPQVYVSAPARPLKGVQFAVHALAGFDRVFLKAGEIKSVTIHLDRRRMQYWSIAAKRWIDASATRTVLVGASSRDLRLRAIIE